MPRPEDAWGRPSPSARTTTAAGADCATTLACAESFWVSDFPALAPRAPPAPAPTMAPVLPPSFCPTAAPAPPPTAPPTMAPVLPEPDVVAAAPTPPPNAPPMTAPFLPPSWLPISAPAAPPTPPPAAVPTSLAATPPDATRRHTNVDAMETTFIACFMISARRRMEVRSFTKRGRTVQLLVTWRRRTGFLAPPMALLLLALWRGGGAAVNLAKGRFRPEGDIMASWPRGRLQAVRKASNVPLPADGDCLKRYQPRPARGCEAAAKAAHVPQQLDLPAWTGGHSTVPYEQNTQQSPCLGRSTVWQRSHS